ncbi:hypothetical protein [Flavobacterium sp. 3HN19-14]|uniref:hypothetical protein n=1 Tax=Flavobacterium sp. 3HN19-14 TaxID=3448133 RepID=UPI003EE346DD
MSSDSSHWNVIPVTPEVYPVAVSVVPVVPPLHTPAVAGIEPGVGVPAHGGGGVKVNFLPTNAVVEDILLLAVVDETVEGEPGVTLR